MWDLDEHVLWRFRRVGCDPRGPGEQLGAQPIGGRLGEVGQRGLGLVATGHLEPELSETEQPGDEWAYDVDGLQPGQMDPTRPAEENAGIHIKIAGLDAVVGEPPRHESVTQCDRHGGHKSQPDLSGSETRGHLLSDEGYGECDDLPASRERSQRVQAARLLGVAAGGEAGHRPADLVSPSIASRSRNRVASCMVSPGMEASVASAAVCSCTVAIPNLRSRGPAATSTNCIRP